ncbi:MAG: transcription antitermination factor NusB [Treponema sp.]|jgi:N utilization substance protein B|nr:transcription antitermination factor NusB [Treponema sp.]
MASRRKGRILAFQALYSWDLVYSQTGKAVIPEGLLDFPWLENEKKTALDEETFAFSRLLITGTVENIAAIDAMISSHLKNWDITRLNRVDLAIMRMSAYTLMYQDETAPSIVINEAIGISKEFGTDDSYRFINGVLDSIHKSLHGVHKALV